VPRKLRWKWLFIMATVVVCILAVTGLPTSRQQLWENVSRNVRLGLDLKGGSHLVLQIQLQDAFKTEADQVIEQLKDVLQKRNITYASMDRKRPELDRNSRDSHDRSARCADGSRGRLCAYCK
jgi:preprotein translocase subunit SecD